jgi:hypothetical protein
VSCCNWPRPPHHDEPYLWTMSYNKSSLGLSLWGLLPFVVMMEPGLGSLLWLSHVFLKSLQLVCGRNLETFEEVTQRKPRKAELWALWEITVGTQKTRLPRGT